MLFHLLYPLHERFGVFNVVRYITFRTAAAVVTALVLALVFGPWFVRTLRRLSIGQNIRDVGPGSHQVKAGTPTMGGLLILFAWLVPTLLWANLGGAYLSKAAASKDKTETAENANKAADALQKAVNLKPNDGAYHNNLGQAYARAGKTQDALKEFQTAAQIDPTSAARYYFNAGAILTNEATKLPPGSPEQKKKLLCELLSKSPCPTAHYSAARSK